MILAANNNTGTSSQQLYQTEVTNRMEAMNGEAYEMTQEKLSAFYSRGVPKVNIWMAVSFCVKMKYHQVSLTWPSTIMYLVCLFLSALTDKEMNKISVCGRESREQWAMAWVMAYLSTVLQICAAAALMFFFDTTGTVTVLLLLGLVMGLVFYWFCRQMGDVPGQMWLHMKEQLKQRFEMSALVVAASVAGLSGNVLGYVDVVVEVEGSASNLAAGGHTAVAPEFFLFCSAVSGLLVVLFCTVPPSVSSNRDVGVMAKKYLPIIAYLALSFLILATVVAAQKILEEYVYLFCCLIAILASLLYFCDAKAGSYTLPETCPARNLTDEREDEANLYKYDFTAGISSILVAIMAIHSSNGATGAASLSGWWKAFMWLAVCSILSHAVRIFILDQMTQNKRYEMSRKFWNTCTVISIRITAVLAVLVICLHPDDVKNIF